MSTAIQNVCGVTDEFPKKQDYEFVRNLSNRKLAWEFLRRNADFKQQYADYVELDRKYSRELVDYPLSMPPAEYSKIFAERRNELDKKRDDLCERFGLVRGIGGSGGLHFDAGVPLFNKLGPTGALYLCQWVDGEKIPMFEDEPLESQLCMDIRIVAEESIEQQLQDIVTYYQAMKRTYVASSVDEDLKKSRRRVNKYPSYLLIFDAYERGFSISEIADVLRPKSEFDDRKGAHGYISDALKAARKLVDRGYLNIAAQDFRK